LFYDTSPYRERLENARDQRTFGIVVFTPSESRRLIAKGILALPEVKAVYREGLLAVCRGTTTAFVVEEILGITLSKANCTAGIVTDGRLASTLPAEGVGPWVFRNGTLSEESLEEAIGEFNATDVAIKGVNAVDPMGNVGILAGNWTGGTIGSLWPTLTARGAHLIVSVGMEKLVPSVAEAARRCGQKLFKYVLGAQVALMPVMNCLVVTEIQALEMLTGVTATHVASGGVGGSEGSVVISLEGSDATVSKAFELSKSVKGEPPIPQPNLMAATIS
jgi:hypothetical protein